jgi:NADH dehydrogenase FAD-containing subunit
MTNVDLARWQFAFTSINHFLFVPITIGLAVLTVEALRDLLRKYKNVDCVMAEVADFDVEGRRVIAERVGGGLLEYGYDDLIVAAGVRSSYFGHGEFARWAPGMKTISHALAIRRRVYGAFEMAATARRPRRNAALT